MPFESTTPLVVSCLLAAVVALVAWLRMQAGWLLAIAALPIGGWSVLDYFLKSWCPLSRCCDGARSIKP